MIVLEEICNFVTMSIVLGYMAAFVYWVGKDTIEWDKQMLLDYKKEKQDHVE